MGKLELTEAIEIRVWEKIVSRIEEDVGPIADIGPMADIIFHRIIDASFVNVFVNW